MLNGGTGIGEELYSWVYWDSGEGNEGKGGKGRVGGSGECDRA